MHRKNQNRKNAIELRKQDGELDEVVVKGGPILVHFERMSDQAVWCGVDVGGKRVRIWIASKNGKSHVSFSAEVE